MTEITIPRDVTANFPLLLTGEEVAQVLKVSRATAYALMRNREIPVVKLGRAVRVREEDLNEYIESRILRG